MIAVLRLSLDRTLTGVVAIYRILRYVFFIGDRTDRLATLFARVTRVVNLRGWLDECKRVRLALERDRLFFAILPPLVSLSTY